MLTRSTVHDENFLNLLKSWVSLYFDTLQNWNVLALNTIIHSLHIALLSTYAFTTTQKLNIATQSSWEHSHYASLWRFTPYTHDVLSDKLKHCSGISAMEYMMTVICEYILWSLKLYSTTKSGLFIFILLKCKHLNPFAQLFVYIWKLKWAIRYSNWIEYIVLFSSFFSAF